MVNILLQMTCAACWYSSASKWTEHRHLGTLCATIFSSKSNAHNKSNVLTWVSNTVECVRPLMWSCLQVVVWSKVPCPDYPYAVSGLCLKGVSTFFTLFTLFINIIHIKSLQIYCMTYFILIISYSQYYTPELHSQFSWRMLEIVITPTA